jgi:hypothetical protein
MVLASMIVAMRAENARLKAEIAAYMGRLPLNGN